MSSPRDQIPDEDTPFSKIITSLEDETSRKRRSSEAYQARWVLDYGPLPKQSKPFIEEATRCYIAGAFGGSVVYCGVAVEAVLYEKLKDVLPKNWNVGILFELATKRQRFDDRFLTAARLIMDARDYHAHYPTGLRAPTKSRYDRSMKEWGLDLKPWPWQFNGLRKIPPQANSFEPYTNTMAHRVLGLTGTLLRRVQNE